MREVGDLFDFDEVSDEESDCKSQGDECRMHYKEKEELRRTMLRQGILFLSLITLYKRALTRLCVL